MRHAGQRLVSALSSESFDLVLLDLGLPDGESDHLVRRLRQSAPGSLPDSLMQVLIMTAAPSGQPHQGAEPWDR